MTCERCGTHAEPLEPFDYCAACGKVLCPRCMREGCCGHHPAHSGLSVDMEIDREVTTQSVHERVVPA